MLRERCTWVTLHTAQTRPAGATAARFAFHLRTMCCVCGGSCKKEENDMPMLCEKNISVIRHTSYVTRHESERAADLNGELSQSACTRVVKLPARCSVSRGGGGSKGGGSGSKRQGFTCILSDPSSAHVTHNASSSSSFSSSLSFSSCSSCSGPTPQANTSAASERFRACEG